MGMAGKGCLVSEGCGVSSTGSVRIVNDMVVCLKGLWGR